MVKKVKKKKIRILPCIILLLILCFFYIIIKFLYSIPIKNIYIYDNVLLSDQEIIDAAGIADYPKYYSFTKKSIEKKLKENPYIESVKVKRAFFHEIKIEVKEYEIILYDYSSKNYILSNGKKLLVENKEITGCPTLVNYVSDEVYDRFIKKLNSLEDNIINQISEIKYEPSQYDESRFFLTMNDGNYIYINLSNFDSLNLYNEIYPNFEGHIGILYLDSGYGEASEYKILK